MAGDEVLDVPDFFCFRRLDLDCQGMDFLSDGVGFHRGINYRQARGREHRYQLWMRLETIRKHKPGKKPRVMQSLLGYRRQNNILAVAWHDKKRARGDTAQEIGRTHRSNHDIGGPIARMGAIAKKVTQNGRSNLLHRWLGEHSLRRHNPEQLQAQTLETPTRKIRNVVHLIHTHLVHHHPDDLDALAIKERLIKGRLVDRTTDSARSDENNLAAKESRNGGIREVENGADAVYFGLEAGFNARARAVNFSLEDLPSLMQLLHQVVI